MPQFDIHTYSSQLFWLMLCCTIVFASFWRVILPRFYKNLSQRQSFLDKGFSQINDIIIDIKKLHQEAADTHKAAELKAREDFNKVRHMLDTEDKEIRLSLLQEERRKLQTIKSQSEKTRHEVCELRPLVDKKLSAFLTKVING